MHVKYIGWSVLSAKMLPPSSLLLLPPTFLPLENTFITWEVLEKKENGKLSFYLGENKSNPVCLRLIMQISEGNSELTIIERYHLGRLGGGE